MDRVIVAEKLESLRRCVTRIDQRRPNDADTLKGDVDLQDILTLNLTRAVQIAVDIGAHVLASTGAAAPETMGEAFRQLGEQGIISTDLAERMVAAVGFRNVAVHSYRSIDWDIVFAISRDHLDDFRAFASSVAKLLDDVPDG